MRNLLPVRLRRLALAAFLLLHGCAAVNDMISNTFDKPKVSLAGAKIESLSFESVGLAFDLDVENPNPITVALAGYDYDFLVDNKSLVSGTQGDRVELAAEKKSVIRVPVRLNYKDIYDVASGLRDRDEANYQINLGFTFELPVLGEQRIPVAHSGAFPLLKMPSLAVESLKLQGLSVSGADITLAVNLFNPNGSSFTLKNISYDFAVSGKQWITADMAQEVGVQPKSESLLEFPIHLDFFEIGRSVFGLLTSDAPLNYHLAGNFDVASSLPLLGNVKVPFNKQGTIDLVK